MILADANGLLLETVGDADFVNRADRVALSAGASWDENQRGSNAISGITIVGSLVVTGMGATTLGKILGTIAVALAMINVVGGYVVTHRMLQMFRKEGDK